MEGQKVTPLMPILMSKGDLAEHAHIRHGTIYDLMRHIKAVEILVEEMGYTLEQLSKGCLVTNFDIGEYHHWRDGD